MFLVDLHYQLNYDYAADLFHGTMKTLFLMPGPGDIYILIFTKIANFLAYNLYSESMLKMTKINMTKIFENWFG